jgi:hypothetical protein
MYTGNQVADTGIRVQLGEAGDNKPNQVSGLLLTVYQRSAFDGPARYTRVAYSLQRGAFNRRCKANTADAPSLGRGLITTPYPR